MSEILQNARFTFTPDATTWLRGEAVRKVVYDNGVRVGVRRSDGTVKVDDAALADLLNAALRDQWESLMRLLPTGPWVEGDTPEEDGLYLLHIQHRSGAREYVTASTYKNMHGRMFLVSGAPPYKILRYAKINEPSGSQK